LEKERVAVAMSGGVDSAVAAVLLIDEGYEVFGITMVLFSDLSHLNNARRVCDILNIPHYVVDYTSIFKEKVIDPFCSEYLAGRTPNPCVACNKFIKMGVLLDKALDEGATYLATGHYTKAEYDPKGERYLLYKGKDRTKDQSYLLWSLSQGQLSYLKTPLGNMIKSEVLKIAKEKSLIELESESQEICFIPDDDYRIFLAEKFDEFIMPGDIVDKKGKVLGRHKGLPFYTIGQRKGLGISNEKPLYVVGLIKDNNIVVVGEEDDLLKLELTASNLNFIPFDFLDKEIKVEAQIRYNMSPSLAKISPIDDDKVIVKFNKRQRAIAPGQSIVFYDGEKVLGGGIIDFAS